jgi:cellulose synthase/poly-beta-1,6-N-acetylglucosamine synthase-like glycosyltransferase
MSPESTPDDTLQGLPTLSVVVSTRNEADNIEALVGGLKTVLPEGSFELIFVDDSDDDTPRVMALSLATVLTPNCAAAFQNHDFSTSAGRSRS